MLDANRVPDLPGSKRLECKDNLFRGGAVATARQASVAGFGKFCRHLFTAH
jgi:hypothetical protein